jgi:hypothetical protein
MKTKSFIAAAALVCLPSVVSALPLEFTGVAPGTTISSFPLVFKGKEVIINRQTKRPELEPALTKILGAKTALEDKDTLQYDEQLVPGHAPTCVVFSWNKKGVLERVLLDAYMEAQNPPAKELKNWLIENAGPGEATKNKKGETTAITWSHQGWRFVFTEGGDGEDSTYGFNITPLKAK